MFVITNLCVARWQNLCDRLKTYLCNIVVTFALMLNLKSYITENLSRILRTKRVNRVDLNYEPFDYRVHPEYPKLGPYRKRNKFIKVLNDRLWDLPSPINLNAW